jgi:2-polyprenyl-3-methyl-5-hydroxy-6-metoxy-1,4-benzoquinol methylase
MTTGEEKKGKQKAVAYYDQEAEDYIKQYREDYEEYPANLIRIKFIINRLRKNNVKTVLDAGCGTCGPMIKLLKKGFDTKGFDFSRDMIRQGKEELKKAGYNSGLVCCADLENGIGVPSEKFDAIIALGVFPHILDEKKALLNIKEFLSPNGSVFIEFRNNLFAAYTLNKYSIDFFLNKIIDLSSLPPEIQNEVAGFYSKRLKADKPVRGSDGKLKYQDILAKFQNPLSISEEIFEPCGFSITKIHFYHYHALPPIFETKYPQLFRKLSLKMEKTDDWRGYLMASAFVVEAKTKD